MESKVSVAAQAPWVLLARALTRVTEVTQDSLASLAYLVHLETLGPQEPLDSLAAQDLKAKGVKWGSVELQDNQASRETLDTMGDKGQRGSQGRLAGRDSLV
ncbi:hypothetical protein COCON_G00045480 [Conger conger]|uniref:Uncharacterized protein n=1 Tax=Conger conger TaxID=82655 RepID=A0A9Q1I4A2_CONCO|nr:hypothetical protein COCON_G00045480 [Conger conger]